MTDPSVLGLPEEATAAMGRVLQRYPMRIPPHLHRIMNPADPRDPIRRQLLPDPRELHEGGDPDPLEEERFRVGPGMIRRFEDRLLCLVHAACPVLCRHCNRKRTWRGPAVVAGPEDISRALRSLHGVREVILSGGEPLLNSDRRLGDLLESAWSSPRIRNVRIHSRIPVSLPSRITPALLRLLQRHRPLWFATQVNHALELTARTKTALLALRDAGIPVLNQAVLLRGVNDTEPALVDLGWALADAGVQPHYLFQLDRAAGTLHFQVPVRRAIRLVAGLRARHSGLIVPHLLADIPGTGGKVPLPEAIVRFVRGGVRLRGSDGKTWTYTDPQG